MPRSTGSYGLLTAFGKASTENAGAKTLPAQNETNRYLSFAFYTFVRDDRASRGCAGP